MCVTGTISFIPEPSIIELLFDDPLLTVTAEIKCRKTVIKLYLSTTNRKPNSQNQWILPE